VKPGKGMAHAKTEAAMASAMASAKSSLYTLAMASITGGTAGGVFVRI
jgi:hypothetical protein